MIKKLLPIWIILIIVCAGAMRTLSLNAQVKHTEPKDCTLTIYNCDMSTAIGWVTWDTKEKKEYTSGDVDVLGKAIIVISVSKGDIYAITQYRWTNDTLVAFKEVEIVDKHTEVKFCYENY